MHEGASSYSRCSLCQHTYNSAVARRIDTTPALGRMGCTGRIGDGTGGS
jgi:hypothetical protein